MTLAVKGALNPNTTNQIEGWVQHYLKCLYKVFFPPTSAEACEKSSGFGKKFVLVLVWENQEKHVRHRPPWYDPSC